MKEWLTAQEIAAEKLPDMPTTRFGVQVMAEREGWNANEYACRPRAGRGGGLEYQIGVLPEIAKIAYRQKHIRVGLPEMPTAANDEGQAPEAPLSGRASLERDARLAILAAFAAFRRGQRIGKHQSSDLFVRAYNARSLSIEPWVVEIVKTISMRSLARWQNAALFDRSALGVDRSAARKGKGLLETTNGGAVKVHILGLIAHQPHLTAKHIRDQVEGKFGTSLTSAKGEAVPLPPIRTFQHEMKRWKAANAVIMMKITDPDAYRSTQKMAGTGTYGWIDEPNALWQIDASPLDALCTDGRKNVYACIDIATRRAVFLISDTPRADAVALLIRKAILAFGVPEKIKTDNGSDFTAKASQRLLASLGIEVEVSDAYSPEQKGHIERLIRTFQHDFAPLLPGFVGHNVADRKRIENRRSFAQRLGVDDAEMFRVAMSAADVQGHADRWAEFDYGRSAHAGLKGKSPHQAAQDAAHTIKRVDERALDILLLPAAGKDGMRTVTKFGIRIKGFHYQFPAGLPGDQVFVRRDPADLGRVFAFASADGGYLGQGTCPALAGIDAATFLKAARLIRDGNMAPLEKQVRDAAKEIASGPSLIELSHKIMKARAIAASENVVPMPKPEVEYSTPAIAAALDAATRDQRPVSSGLTGRAAEKHAEMLAEAKGRKVHAAHPQNVQTLRRNETPRMRYLRALGLEKRIASGEAVETGDAIWLGGYQTDAEYRVQKKFHENNGAPLSL